MNRLSQKQARLMQQLMECKDMVRGSLNSVCGRCKRANCTCKTGSGNLNFRLTYKDLDQRTQIVYVSRERVSEMKRLIRTYAKFRDLMEELVETNIEIFKSGAKP